MSIRVSFSEIQVWQQCTRQHYYKYGLGLSPNVINSPALTGISGHKMAEVFFKALSEGKTKEEAYKLAERTPSNPPLKEEINALIVFKRYVDSLDVSTIKVVHVERKFEVRLHPKYDIIVTFVCDLVLETSDNTFIIEDCKFSGRSWGEKKLSRYSQLKVYALLLTLLGYTVEKAYLRILNVTTYKPTYKLYTIKDTEIERIRLELVNVATEIGARKQLPVAVQERLSTRTLNPDVCEKCPFVFPCQLELEGKDASRTLATEYTEYKKSVNP